MDKLKPQDLLSLEAYHKQRSAFRAEVLAHKRDRQAAVGPNVTLYFEDRLTMQYQIQEMLRAERIYESEAIAEELAAYNPLIPDGSNLKATMMLEYPDVAERRVALEALAGVEQTRVRRGGEPRPRVRARGRRHAAQQRRRRPRPSTSCASSSTTRCAQQLKSGAPLRIGVDHPQYTHELVASATIAKALAADLHVILSLATRARIRYNPAGLRGNSSTMRPFERESR